MSIWNRQYTIEEIKQRGKGTVVEHVGIEITEIGDDYIKGTIPVDERTKQPIGILHGGSSVLLAESLGSVAANMSCAEGYVCVGIEVNANHLKSVRDGVVTGIARPIHLGRSTQVWDIQLENEQGQKTCVSRLTMAVIEK